MKRKNNSGFSLIEILVVVAIIGLLASVIVVAVNGARKKSRNARRTADNKQVITAFGLAYNASPTLPTSGGFACISTSCTGGWSGFPIVAAVDSYLSPYMPKKPEDPTDTSRGFGGYVYNLSWNPGVGPYDGTTFLTGAYLIWMLEPPYTNGACGLAKVYNVTSAFVECIYKLD